MSNIHNVARGSFAALVAAAALASAPAAALTVTYVASNRVLDPNYYQQLFGATAPMLPPGDVALIDDYFHNSVLDYQSAVQGNSLGIRSTSPTGVVSTNTVSRGTSCWVSGLTQWCPAYSSGTWEMGTNIRFQPVGQWKVDVLNNGAVVSTFFFQLKPYNLSAYSGATQSIPVKSVTPQPLVARVTLPDGATAGAGKTVVFSVTAKPSGTKSPGAITTSPTYTGGSNSTLTATTDASGAASVFFETGDRVGSYVVTATSALAPGVSRTFTVTANGTDPLDAAIKEKNLGLDPANNSACAGASRGFTPNPINIATGNKVRAEPDYVGAGPFPLELTRYYNSVTPRIGAFGNNWRGSYDRSIVVTSVTVKGKTTTTAEAVRHDGRVLKYTLTNGVWLNEPDAVDRLESLAGGGFRLTCGNDQVEQYTAAGKLSSVAAREGFGQTLAYDAQGRLAQVTDTFGRSLVFAYDTSNRVSAMTDPAGKISAYSYSSAGNLVDVQYPDMTLRRYHYENAGFPRALTGITDETGQRFATFAYDGTGRAVYSTLAGGAQSSTLLFYTNGARDVQDASGSYRRYGFSLIQGVARRTSLDNAACGSCGTATTTTAYSTSGFVSAITDYRGTQTTFLRDARGLETSRTEAVGTTEARITTTTWHATFRLPLVITRPGRSTAFTYDSAGRMLTRTEADTSSGATRRWTYTYNSQGLLATLDGPRTDVADTTTYTYTLQGNLASVTNAKGHVTRYTSYDEHGRPLSMTDPNGLVTSFSYDLRGRLLTRSAGGQVTSFSYTAAGQPLRTTQPDGSFIERQYDAAQQLIGMTDSAGQRIAYTLDLKGQRIREEHFDALASSVYQRGWTYDPLGHVLSELDAQAAVQWRHAYDANGNRSSSTDALGQTATRAYDALDRLKTSTDPLGAATAYTYDARDNLLRVTDPRGVLTQYAYDGLDNLIQESTPDAGVSSFAYDAAGNLKTRSWANGRAVAFTLDALNRVTLEDYGAGVQLSYAYDNAANGIGRLGASADGSGANAWAYDLWGRVTLARRSAGARVLDTGYGYDGAGRLSSMSYPSGRVIGYGYDSAGRVASMSVDAQSLLGGIAWQPFGGSRGWTQGNGRVVGKSFDRDGRLAAQSFDVGTRGYAYDAKGRVAQVAEPWGNRSFGYDAADRLSSEAAWSGNWSYGWDGNGNRLSQSTPLGTTSYGYVAGSNRIDSAAGIDARTFMHDASGNLTAEGGYAFGYDARNRLASASGGSTAASYAYDAMGRRVLKVRSGVNRHYAHDEQRKVIGEYDDAGAITETVWLGSTPVAVLRGGATYWVDADQIDAPRAVRNAADQIVWRWRSEAFGNQAPEEDPSGLGAFEFNHRLPGQMFDAESALHHNDHRDYRAHTGRYVESDPVGLEGGNNRYSYVNGNPVMFVDPTGLLCTYSQSAGSMICIDQAGQVYYNEKGYAGTGSGRNNPSAQGQRSVGPLPQGTWQVVGPWYNSANTGRDTVKLTPLTGNMCSTTGRDCNSFRIHGNNSRNDASQGCIVLPPNRTLIPPGETILVVP